jgi:hypothetical protein
MAEVTKKDLQSLQGYCNKQIADLEKRLLAKIDESDKHITDSVNKTIEVLNKNDAELLRGHTDQTKRMDEQTKRLDKITEVVNQHAKVINEMD